MCLCVCERERERDCVHLDEISAEHKFRLWIPYMATCYFHFLYFFLILGLECMKSITNFNHETTSLCFILKDVVIDTYSSIRGCRESMQLEIKLLQSLQAYKPN